MKGKPLTYLREKRGLTLLEVMVSSVLFFLFLFSSYSLLRATIHGNAAATRLSRATALSIEKIEEMKNQPFSALIAVSPCPSAPPTTAEYIEATFYRWTCVTNIIFGTSPVKAKQVDVYIQYHALMKTRTIMKSTIIASP